MSEYIPAQTASQFYCPFLVAESQEKCKGSQCMAWKPQIVMQKVPDPYCEGFIMRATPTENGKCGMIK